LDDELVSEVVSTVEEAQSLWMQDPTMYGIRMMPRYSENESYKIVEGLSLVRGVGFEPTKAYARGS